MADFEISDQGTVVMVTPRTEAAKEWTTENVDVPGWAWMGSSFAVDHRMADPLIDGIEEAGFSVEAA